MSGVDLSTLRARWHRGRTDCIADEQGLESIMEHAGSIASALERAAVEPSIDAALAVQIGASEVAMAAHLMAAQGAIPPEAVALVEMLVDVVGVTCEHVILTYEEAEEGIEPRVVAPAPEPPEPEPTAALLTPQPQRLILPPGYHRN